MQPKNLLFIMSDQHGPHALGCYGNPVVQTPTLDALATGGTRFANAVTPTPICVPARASFATGRYAHTIDAWDNAKPYTGAEAPSWGHRLVEHGHAVTTIGKLHYRQENDPSGFPDQRLPMHVLNGIGDRFGLLRGEMPVRTDSRQHVLDARAGESEYIRYDRAVADASVQYLQQEAGDATTPWALFASFVTPHFPLIAPAEYVDQYPLDEVPLPIDYAPGDWPHHPAIAEHRRRTALDQPLTQREIRNAIAAYYGMVTFLDEQIGKVLRALDAAGLRDETRIVYTSDHGEMLGEHGLWWKSSMYDASVGVPLILSGPDVPRDHVVTTNASLIDAFPTILEAVGVEPTAEDVALPGESLWRVAREPDRPRTVFSEYHTVFHPNAMYMVQSERYKFVLYVGHPPQLFDRQADSDERHDLAADPRHADTRTELERELRTILAPGDPETIDTRAKADQRRRIEEAGGLDAVLSAGLTIPYTPAPAAFTPANPTGRDRATVRQD